MKKILLLSMIVLLAKNTMQMHGYIQTINGYLTPDVSHVI